MLHFQSIIFSLGLVLSLQSGKALALTNSQPALEDHFQAEVEMKTEGRTSDGDSVPNYCNATLVSSRILVTAAHCVAQSWFLHANSIDVSVGHYKYSTRPDGQVVRIGYVNYLQTTGTAQFVFSRELQNRFQSGGVMTSIPPEQDYAIVVLSTPLNLPVDFPYRKIVSRTQFEQVKSAIARLSPLVCTGNPWEDLTTTDTKRSAVLNQISWNSSGWFESTSTARVEEGDSGSGLLVKIGAEYQLVAVTKGRGSSWFSNWDSYISVVGKVCDLSQNVSLNADERSTLCR